MSYTPTTWQNGDVITAAKLNNIENGIAGNIVEEVTVSGTTPTITASENKRYVCGEVTSLTFTPCAAGICEVVFTAGSTAPTVTLPSTVKMPEWYEVEANTTYEISILNGVYGVVMSWTA